MKTLSSIPNYVDENDGRIVSFLSVYNKSYFLVLMFVIKSDYPTNIIYVFISLGTFSGFWVNAKYSTLVASTP